MQKQYQCSSRQNEEREGIASGQIVPRCWVVVLIDQFVLEQVFWHTDWGGKQGGIYY